MMAVIKKIGAEASSKMRKTTAKSKSKKKLNQEELNSLIAKKAYELYVRRGYSHGSDWADWYEAEKIVLSGRG